MSSFSSGVGLVSGMDIEGIVTQLMEIEARSRVQIESRVEDNTEEQTALMMLQAKVMAVQLSASNFNDESIFSQKAVTSSNEDIMAITSTKYAVEGNYKFFVDRLATQHSFVSRSYSDFTSSIGAGAISFEIGNGQLSQPTNLSFLNGNQGVQTGRIKMTDSDGNSAEIDLTTVLNIQDVMDKINDNSTINVTASVSGDHLVITDNAAGSGMLTINEVGTGHTAADLGILGTDSGREGRITGQNINFISADTLITDLNDGNGIRSSNLLTDEMLFNLGDGSQIGINLAGKMFKVNENSDDPNLTYEATTLRALNSGKGVRRGIFRITDQNKNFVDIDLDAFYSSADYGPNATMAHLEKYVQEQIALKYSDGEMDIALTFQGMDHITLTDNSEKTGSLLEEDGTRISNFIIEDLSGYAAADLGIVSDVSGDTVTGDSIYRMETLGDIINAVNNDWQNWQNGQQKIELAINENGLQINDLTGLGVTVSAMPDASGDDYRAAGDLGLLGLNAGDTGQRLIAGLNSVMLQSLNGGTGGDPDDPNYGANRITSDGVIELTDRAGNPTVTLNIAGDASVQDVLDAINNAGTNIQAQINQTGNGISLNDTTLAPAAGSQMIVAGDIAEKLGMSVNQSVSTVDSGNLQRQYMNESIKLSEMKNGEGISRGKFTIVDGQGGQGTVNLLQDKIVTLADVINEINTAGTNIRARINDTGDGLLLVDTSENTGDGLLAPTVIEGDDGTATDLGLLIAPAQQAADGTYYIDGSYEVKFEIGGGDSVEDLVTRVNDADMGVKASLINDGNGYRISFISQVSGSAGNVHLDAGTTNLAIETLTTGRDAVVLFGDGTEDHPLIIRSDSNTIKDAVKGTTLELKGAGEVVDVSVKKDIDSIVEQMGSFVESYNAVMADIAELTKFNPDTLEKGVLFADHTVSLIKQSMLSLAQKTITGVSTNYNRLSKVGITFAPMGSESGTDANGDTINYAVAGTNKLEFDETMFRDAFETDPDAVTDFFTTPDVGIGDYIADQLEKLASTSTDSTIKSRVEAIQQKNTLFNKRIDYLNDALERKEARLYNSFYAMEQVLAKMQSQQSSLSQLSAMATTTS